MACRRFESLASPWGLELRRPVDWEAWEVESDDEKDRFLLEAEELVGDGGEDEEEEAEEEVERKAEHPEVRGWTG